MCNRVCSALCLCFQGHLRQSETERFGASLPAGQASSRGILCLFATPRCGISLLERLGLKMKLLCCSLCKCFNSFSAALCCEMLLSVPVYSPCRKGLERGDKSAKVKGKSARQCCSKSWRLQELLLGPARVCF